MDFAQCTYSVPLLLYAHKLGFRGWNYDKAALINAAVYLLQHAPCIVGSGHNGVIVEKQYDHSEDPINGNEDPANSRNPI